MKERYEVHPRDPYKLNIHKLAKQMVADGFFGQNMREPEKCEENILVAAYDADIESRLSANAFAFWEVCDFKYRLWMARRQFRRPAIGAAAPRPAPAKVTS